MSGNSQLTTEFPNFVLDIPSRLIQPLPEILSVYRLGV